MGGKVVIFSAPSGAGKTTIVRALLNQGLGLEFSISACSRPKRKNEADGKDYYFLSVDEFKKKIENNEFLEWEEVYKNQFYGTLHSEVRRIWAKGKSVVFDVDVIGGMKIKKIYGNRALSVFVMPPSVDTLKARLVARSTEDEISLEKRLKKAEHELSFASKFDLQIVNENLELAIDESRAAVSSFLSVD